MAVITMKFSDDDEGGVNVNIQCTPPLNEGDEVTPAMEVAAGVMRLMEEIKEVALAHLEEASE